MNLLETLDYYNLDHKKTINESSEPFGTNKELVGYISGYYNQLFSNFQHDKLKIVEIGTWYGGSLYLWEKFFLNSEIYGIDPNPEHNKFIPLAGIPKFVESEVKFEDYLQDSKIKFYKNDAYNFNFLNNLFEDESIDILIDDGPHTVSLQKSVLELYYKKIKQNGYIIVEDVIDSNISELMNYYNTFDGIDVELSFSNSTLNKKLFNIITIKKINNCNN